MRIRRRRPLAGVALALAGLVATGCSSSAAPASPASSTAKAAGATPRPIPTALAATEAPASASAAGAPAKLLILGDSIAIASMGCGACTGWDQQYEQALTTKLGRPVSLRNEARPNYRMQDLQQLLDDNASIQEAVAKADVVVVSVGYNNGPSWDPADPCHAPVANTDAEGIRISLKYLNDGCVDKTLAQYKAVYDTIFGRIEQLAAGRAQLRIDLGVYANLLGNPGGDGTLSQLTPAEMAAAISQYDAIIDKWNAMECEAAKAHAFVCADVHHAFNGPDGRADVGPLVNPNDYVHPKEAGQAKIAQLLEAIPLPSSLAKGS